MALNQGINPTSAYIDIVDALSYFTGSMIFLLHKEKTSLTQDAGDSGSKACMNCSAHMGIISGNEEEKSCIYQGVRVIMSILRIKLRVYGRKVIQNAEGKRDGSSTSSDTKGYYR